MKISSRQTKYEDKKYYGNYQGIQAGIDYLKYDEDGNVQDTQRAVNDVNLDIEAGQFVAVLGHNGSGNLLLQST